MRENTYKRYFLAVLLVILCFNGVDRLALGLLLQDIKVDLDLTDTQLGFLSGIAFALFYSVMGLPIARWADRGNRVAIITITTAVWSAAVALCGFTANFVQLLLIRIGVAVGEAGCIPPAHSLIADYFTRAERPRAVAIYLLGGQLSVVGYFGAGWLNELYGWRVTFMLLGLPGLALAALAGFTLREPRRGKSTVGAVSKSAPGSLSRPGTVSIASEQPGLKDVCITLWANNTFRHLLFGFSVILFFAAGTVQWLPAFFIRSHGLQTGELGTWLAVTYGSSGLLGVYLGGELASRYAAHNERLQLRVIAFAYVMFFGVISAFVYIVPDYRLAFGLMAVAGVGGAMAQGPLFATIQTLVPPRMRATSIALIYLFANLIGLGFGPLAAGALSDALRPWAGEESLRYALLALTPGYWWAAWHMWRASKTVTHDLDTVQVDQDVALEEVGTDALDRLHGRVVRPASEGVGPG